MRVDSPVVSHKLVATQHEVSLHAKALEQTRDLWRQEFGTEYLYDFDATVPPVPPYFVDNELDALVENRGPRQTFQSSSIDKLDGAEGLSWTNPLSYVQTPCIRVLLPSAWCSPSITGANGHRGTDAGSRSSMSRRTSCGFQSS